MPIHRNCEGFSRRNCLRLGLGALGGVGLIDLLRLRGRSADSAKTPVPKAPTSCILIWMDGGPSHFETFDPKPEAPIEIRGELGTVATRIPGVYFSEHLPKLAACRTSWPSSARCSTTRGTMAPAITT
jgi:hypothetical protein